MTAKELIEYLQTLPEDTIVGTLYEGYRNDGLTPTFYPLEKEGFELMGWKLSLLREGD